jgi:protein associated with RNAse G/E
MEPGQQIIIRALKASGEAYRWWPAVVESVTEDRLITLSNVGHTVDGPKGGWVSRFDVRGVYWFDRSYNLTELYLPNGHLKQIYIHVASPPTLCRDELVYTDHELDVVLRPGHPVRLLDEHEFIEACDEYGYSPDFQEVCRDAAIEALRLAKRWKPVGPPCGSTRQFPPCSSRTTTPASDSSTRKTDV